MMNIYYQLKLHLQSDSIDEYMHITMPDKDYLLKLEKYFVSKGIKSYGIERLQGEEITVLAVTPIEDGQSMDKKYLELHKL